jgi:hypothetical protein
MNEATLMQLKVLVERAVRPVSAALRNKQKMREEMLAHVIAVFEQELHATGDEAAALARTAERFGDPAELTDQLQATVPARDTFDRLLDRVWFRPGEPTLRRAVRHALLLDLLALAYMAAMFALLYGAVGDLLGGRLPAAAMVVYTTSVLLGMFFFVIGFTFLAEWLRRVLDGRAGRAWLQVLLIAVASSLLVPGLGFALWLDGTHANLRDLLVVFALGLVVPGMVVHLAKALATRLRDHREWASLPLDGTSV